jgi:DNA-3-methyladenine glycosylase II
MRMFSETIEMTPVSPYRLSFTAWALRRRPHNIVDRWDGVTYRRVLILDGAPMEIAVTQRGTASAPRLRVIVQGESDPVRVREEIIESIALLLGTGIDMTSFYAVAAREPRLKALAERFMGFKPPRYPSLFEALANAIVCQQVSLANGIHIMCRLAARWGRSFRTTDARAFPLPADIARVDVESLREIGLSFNKARALLDCARACSAGGLDDRELAEMDDTTALETLDALWGVGPWTAQYVLLRGLGRLHVFPEADSGALNGLRRLLSPEGPSGTRHGKGSASGIQGRTRASMPAPLEPEKVRRYLARWRPYAGLVYFHLLLMRLEREKLLE